MGFCPQMYTSHHNNKQLDALFHKTCQKTSLQIGQMIATHKYFDDRFKFDLT